MRGFRLVVSVLLVSLFMAACGGGTSKPEEDSPISGYEARVAEALCERYVRCQHFPDLLTCKEAYPPPVQSQVVADVNAGRLVYDSDAEAACLDVLRAMGCNRTDPSKLDLQPCDDVFTGAVADGGTCFLSRQCVSGWCNRGLCSSEEECCPGTCQPLPQVTISVPVGGDCTPPDAVCVEHSRCVSSDGGTYVCAPDPTLGDPCDPNHVASSWCLDGVNCVPSESVLGGTCTLPPATGEPCDLEFRFCDSYNDFCDPLTGSCMPLILPGQPCPAGTGCVQYAVCDSNKGICVALRNRGEACSDAVVSTRCLSHLECIMGSCILRPHHVTVCQ